MAEFGVTGSFTISFWADTTTIAAGTSIFYTFDNAGSNRFYLRRDNDGLILGLSDWQPTFANTLVADKMYFFVVVLDGTTGAFYLDNVLLDSQAGIVVDLGSADDGFIGSDAGSQYFHSGLISDFRIYSEAKSSSWIAEQYAKGVPDAMVLHSLVTGAEDLSVNGNDGTPSGGVVLGQGGVFDGVDDKIDYGDIGNIQEVEFWIKPASTTEDFVQIDTSTKGIFVSSGTISYLGLSSSATYVNGVATTISSAGFWQHVVCQFTQVDADNFEVGFFDPQYGEFSMRDLRVRDSISSADAVKISYLRQRKYY